MEQKNDNLLLGLAFVGLIAYFVYNEEKKKKIKDAKNSTLSQTQPIITELSTTTPDVVPPAPTRLPKYKLLEDAIFWDENSVRNDDGTYANVSFIIPKDTIVSGIENSDGTISVKTEMGNAIIRLSSVTAMPDDTTESSQIAFSCRAYLVTNINPIQMDDYGGEIDTISDFHFIGCGSEEQYISISNLQAPMKIMAIEGTVFSQDPNIKIDKI
jgi:hypothetical protein